MFADKWLICTFPSREYNIDDYPAVKEYLLSFTKEKLEQSGKTYNINGTIIKSRKKTTNKWFETQDSISYWVIKTPEDLRPVITQLKRIGNNINQIAVKVNSGAVYSVNFDEVIEMQNKIYEKVFEIANADSQIY